MCAMVHVCPLTRHAHATQHEGLSINALLLLLKAILISTLPESDSTTSLGLSAGRVEHWIQPSALPAPRASMVPRWKPDRSVNAELLCSTELEERSSAVC